MEPPAPMSVTAGRTIGLILAPTKVRIIQTVGLTLSLYASGQLLSASFTTVPALLKSPASLLLQQYRRIMRDARLVSTLASAFSSAGFTWLAMQEPTWNSRSFFCYAAGALITTSALNFSVFGMAGTEGQLDGRDVMSEKFSEKENDGAQLRGANDQVGKFVSRNAKLLGSATDEMSVHQLVDRWAFLNAIRGGLMTLGAAVALWGVVCNDLSVFELFEMAYPPSSGLA